MKMSVIFLAIAACCCTYGAVWRVVFRKQWEREQMKFLREKFGVQSPQDEETVFGFWRSSVPMWMAAAATCWIALAFELAGMG